MISGRLGAGGSNRSRCHLSLERDAPEPRAVHGPEMGRDIELPEVGGLLGAFASPWAAAGESFMATDRAATSPASVGSWPRSV